MLVLGFLGRGFGVSQGQLLFVPAKGQLLRSYKAICRWLPLVLGLGVPDRGLNCKPRLAAAGAGLGAAYEEVRACQG